MRMMAGRGKKMGRRWRKLDRGRKRHLDKELRHKETKIIKICTLRWYTGRNVKIYERHTDRERGESE